MQWCEQDLHKTKTKTKIKTEWARPRLWDAAQARPRPRPRLQNQSQDQDQDLTEYDSEFRLKSILQDMSLNKLVHKKLVQFRQALF